MCFTIENTTFYKVPKIFFIKSNSYNLEKFEVIDNSLKGIINIDLEYFDPETKLHKSNIKIEYIVDLPESFNVCDVELKDIKLHTIDNLGVDCNYILQINPLNEEVRHEELEIIIEEPSNDLLVEDSDESIIDVIEEKEEPITFVQEMKIQNTINEEIKQELTNTYDKLLEESLEKREAIEDTTLEVSNEEEIVQPEISKVNDVNVEIISTKTKDTEDNFISFFNSFETRYYGLKTLHCPNEEGLNQISKDYKINIETLLKSYDKESKTVIVKDVDYK